MQSTGIEHFDELPIPFRAVATDVNTGEMVLFEKGSLADAMRASMSVPGVFSPVEIEGRILIDGGVVNNIPIDVARQMGVDIIVAVNVSLPLSSSEELDSVLAISMQTLGINSAENFKKQVALLGENDLLITVNLEEISSVDFHRVTEIIELGEKAAEDFTSQLRQYSVSTEEYQRFLLKQREDFDFVAPIKIDFVEVNEPERVSIRAVKAKIKIKPGQTVDLETIEKDLTRISPAAQRLINKWLIKTKSGFSRLWPNQSYGFSSFPYSLPSNRQLAHGYKFLAWALKLYFPSEIRRCRRKKQNRRPRIQPNVLDDACCYACGASRL